MERTNQVIMLVGRRKAGKTYLGRKIIDTTKFEKILVVDTFEHPDYKDFQTIQPEMLPRWKKGKKRILCYDQNDEAFKAINDHVKNTLIVMEDCTKYMIGDLSKSIRGIIFDSKQKNNDVLLMYHGFSFAPPKLLSNVNYITLFKIGENIENAKSKIPNYETILKGHREIQASANPYINKTFLVN
ncbi:MAG TPA: hypothetical protein PKC41_09555 [Chitinophagaceae bacterium]|nr:hypothetical protein [Chitinophagaceae bacterium]